MPSFQTRLKITGLKPGNAPEAVMAAAVEALERGTTWNRTSSRSPAACRN